MKEKKIESQKPNKLKVFRLESFKNNRKKNKKKKCKRKKEKENDDEKNYIFERKKKSQIKKITSTR